MSQRRRLARILAVLLISCLPLQAMAISAQELHAALTGSELYIPGNAGCSATITVAGNGTLPSSVPAPYNGIFTQAANAYKIPPALLAGIFYGGEHGNSWPPPTGDSSGHWANSGVGGAWPDGVQGARGPFQFEYTTWQQYGVDGNQDGQKDPDNLVDAAFGAANYLAASGGKLPNPNLQQAIFAYNHAQFYVDDVIAAYKKFGGTAGLNSTTGFQTIENLFSQSAYADTTTPAPTTTTAPTDGSGGGSNTFDNYTLPATKGGTGTEGATSGFALGAPKTPDELKYFINMRWSYAAWNWDGTNTVTDAAQAQFMASNHPRLIVTDPVTNKSVIVDALDAGPAPWTGTPYSASSPPSYWQTPQTGTPSQYTGRVSGLAPAAMEAIGATERLADGSGDDLLYAWDSDQTDPLGSTTKTVTGYDATGNSCGSAAAGSVDGASIIQTATAEYNKHPTEWDSTILGYTAGAEEDWCADFVSWVFKQAGHPFGSGSSWKIPAAVGVEQWFQKNGTWVANQPGAPPPQPGDVYYINYSGGATGGGNDHVGFVVSASGGTLKTLNGNWGSTIGYQDYPNYQQNTEIIGWGRLK